MIFTAESADDTTCVHRLFILTDWRSAVHGWSTPHANAKANASAVIQFVRTQEVVIKKKNNNNAMAPVVELAAAWGGNYLCVYNHASLTKHSPALLCPLNSTYL